MKFKLLTACVCFVLCGLLIPVQQVFAEELEEEIIYFTEEEQKAIIEESMGNIIAARSSAVSLSMSVDANKSKTTAFFKKTKGSSIGIGIELSKKGKAGIMDGSGKTRVVNGTSLYHSFDITYEHIYCVIVVNPNDSKITANGYFRP